MPAIGGGSRGSATGGARCGEWAAGRWCVLRIESKCSDDGTVRGGRWRRAASNGTGMEWKRKARGAGRLKGPGKVHGKGISRVGPARACIGSLLLLPKKKRSRPLFHRYIYGELGDDLCIDPSGFSVEGGARGIMESIDRLIELNKWMEMEWNRIRSSYYLGRPLFLAPKPGSTALYWWA